MYSQVPSSRKPLWWCAEHRTKEDLFLTARALWKYYTPVVHSQPFSQVSAEATNQH